MLPNDQPLFTALLGSIFIWLTILSFFLYKMISSYNRLGKGVTKENLSSVLNKIAGQLELSKKELAEISGGCDKLEHEGTFHIQKIGLLRFNPFSDTGGDQSFILAILNGRDDGVLLSSLHSRSGTRWYTKKIKEGKGVEHVLSNEEKETIKSARLLTSERSDRGQAKGIS